MFVKFKNLEGVFKDLIPYQKRIKSLYRKIVELGYTGTEEEFVNFIYSEVTANLGKQDIKDKLDSINDSINTIIDTEIDKFEEKIKKLEEKEIKDISALEKSVGEVKKDIKSTQNDIEELENNVLLKNNENAYTPSSDYNPATKKYVDVKVDASKLKSIYSINISSLSLDKNFNSPNNAYMTFNNSGTIKYNPDCNYVLRIENNYYNLYRISDRALGFIIIVNKNKQQKVAIEIRLNTPNNEGKSLVNVTFQKNKDESFDIDSIDFFESDGSNSITFILYEMNKKEDINNSYYLPLNGHIPESLQIGTYCSKSGMRSFSVGYNSHTLSDNSVSVGKDNTVIGSQSFASGEGIIVSSENQFIQGKYNLEDIENKYIHIVGNGKYETTRSNAHTLDWDGNAWYAGNVYTGGTGQDDENAKKLATEEFVTKPKDYFILKDSINKYNYVIQMQNGSLISFAKAASIKVTTPPTKTDYTDTEEFDPTGMVVIAVGEDGSEREIADYAYEKYVTTESSTHAIRYIEAGTEYTTEVPIITRTVEEALVDFSYTVNSDGTYTITGWKGTHNGVTSTEMIFPNSNLVIL